ncbi:MAG: MBL fold metallo-hydrolase [Angelakisella sp.]|nr:MBL fold metallo-hydrolase [Angelakisella sp.]
MDLEKYRKSYSELMKIQNTKNLDYYAYPAKYYVKPFLIAGNVYYIGDKKVCSHLIDTGDGLIVFDSGFPGAAHLMINAIWELGFNPHDVKYLIHSHEHFDHIGAACEFKELYDTKLVISEAGAQIMKNHPNWVYMDAAPYPKSPIFTPDITLKDGEIFSLGKVNIRCVHTPGHSPGVMSFFFTTEDAGSVYKFGYFGGAGYNTLYKEGMEAEGRPLSAREDFIHSLKKVMDEDVDIVLGNHPLQNDTLQKREQMLACPTANPFIDPQEWGKFCRNLIEQFQEFINSGN